MPVINLRNSDKELVICMRTIAKDDSAYTCNGK